MNHFKKAPVKNKAPIKVVLAHAKDGGDWDKHIRPVIRAKNPGRTAFRWKWIVKYLPYGTRIAFGWAAKRYTALKAMTPGANNVAALSGLIAMVEGVQYPLENKKCLYVWFLESAPDTYITGKGADLVPKSGEALLDAAIVTSIKAGFEGRLLLHADPAGGQDLLDYYTHFGLKSVDPSLPINIRRATNDGRYFYADEQTAAYIVRRNNRYR